MEKMLLFVFFMSFSAQSLADCTLKKAAANKVLDARVGISGSCDKAKVIESKTDKVAKAKKVREIKKERDAKNEDKPSSIRKKDEDLKNKISESHTVKNEQ